MKTISAAMKWRYATQIFDNEKKPTRDDILKLLDIARLSPSWYGLQPWKFILVENTELRKQLRENGYNQAKITDAPYFVVFASKVDYTEQDVDTYIKSMAKAQDKSLEDLKGFRDAVVNGFLPAHKNNISAWASNQTHIAFGVFIAAAAMEGIDAGPMGGFDPGKYDEILGLKELGLHAEVICALGYRSDTDEAAKRNKSRFSLGEVLIEK